MFFSKDDIEKYLPHRDPFLFIDEVISIEEGNKIHAAMCIRDDNVFLEGHFPNNPIVPGVILIEAMGQASGILGFKTMNKTPEEGSIYYFVGADNLRFKRPAVPGDQLVLSSKVITNKKGIWKFDCKATVEEELVSEAVILCADRPK